MRLLLDANLSPTLREGLRAVGHEVVHVGDVGSPAERCGAAPPSGGRFLSRAPAETWFLLEARRYHRVMAVDGTVTRRWDSARDLFGDAPPTEDDVPIASDGRRLDTPEKVRAFLAEISAGAEGGA